MNGTYGDEAEAMANCILAGAQEAFGLVASVLWRLCLGSPNDSGNFQV